MLSTAIGIEFNVNDLDANYEIIGTSDNYSFQYKLGRGSSLVDDEGDLAQKTISLKGNYGEFNVKVFAVSDIGIRSAFIEDTINVSAPDFSDTFSFSDIRISKLGQQVNIEPEVIQSPDQNNNKLVVFSEYVDRSANIEWSLTPPLGHAKEGQPLSTELLSDAFFDHFKIRIFNTENSIEFTDSELSNSSAMANTLLSPDVTGALQSYRDFSLNLNSSVFDDLNFDRNISVEVVSHDSFGNTATGLISGINYSPSVLNLSAALRGSDISFSWIQNDRDYSSTTINALSIPKDQPLYNSGDLQASLAYYESLASASRWDGISNYRVGDKVNYQDIVYECKVGHNANSSRIPQESYWWKTLEPVVDYSHNEYQVIDQALELRQIWGYKYYYTFQSVDGFGTGQLFNLTDEGISPKGSDFDTLDPFLSELKIGNLRFREREDDLVFNWDIVDQEGNTVNIDEYKFALSNSDVPSVLGISGSLFDADTNLFLTGITEGNNSRSTFIDEDGQIGIATDLPTTEVFNTFEYTRELNNQIYGTGGFIFTAYPFDKDLTYGPNDVVIGDDGQLYIAARIPPTYTTNKPTDFDSYGVPGTFTVDNGFYYLCVDNNTWLRKALTIVSRESSNAGEIYSDDNFHYVCISGTSWGKFPIAEFDRSKESFPQGFIGQVYYDKQYFNVYTSQGWKSSAFANWGGYSSSIIINEFERTRPTYPLWFAGENYEVDDVVEYDQQLYKVDQDFGPQSTLGVFDYNISYPSGVLIVAPEDGTVQPFEVYSSFVPGDKVIYKKSIYESLTYQSESEVVKPDADINQWRLLSLFNDIDCAIFKSTTQFPVIYSNDFEFPEDGNINYQSEVPDSIIDSGTAGQFSLDSGYLYLCIYQNNWIRAAITIEEKSTGSVGDRDYDDDFYYFCLGGTSWGKIALAASTKSDAGNVGDIYYDSDFFYVLTSAGWKRFTMQRWAFLQVAVLDSDHWQKQNPEISDKFSLLVPGFPYEVEDWISTEDYFSGQLVVYDNTIWSGVVDNGPNFSNGYQIPNSSPAYWSAPNISTNFAPGDRVYYDGQIYKALQSNPTGAPIFPSNSKDYSIESTYQQSQWAPFWELNQAYDGLVFNHIGIPESGKRSVGLEVGIINNEGDILQLDRITGFNPEPSIIPQGFNVDSVSESTKVKFNFNYSFGSQEKTTKVQLYRSENPNFSILDSKGLPGTGASTFVKEVLGAGDATFGQNITQIIDEPPVPSIPGYGEQITGYYYKILPFDDFGSGDLYGVSNNQGVLERVLVYPKSFSSQNPNAVPGRVFRTNQNDIPGPVINLTGRTSFENYFFNWQTPNSNLGITGNIPNDISHYEVWQSEDPTLYFGSLNKRLNQQDNLKGYRRIEADIESTGPIPIEQQDPALGISNATKIFDIDALSPSISASHFGTTNDTRYFWVRAVDHAGNKSPFTGSANFQGNNIEGLKLILGQAKTTDIADFEQNISNTFHNIVSLVPNNPFVDNDPDSSSIRWDRHFVYHKGVGYVIGGDSSSDKFIWWQPTGSVAITPTQSGELGLVGPGGGPLDSSITNPLRNVLYSGNYNTLNYHPAGGDENDPILDFNDGDFIIARNSQGVATPVWHSFANATIGTAQIENAAIVDAKIKTLTADKITAGVIQGQDVQVGGTGQIRSAGFDGLDLNNPNPQQGFALSGDGSFVFQTQNGKLYFDDNQLVLEGKLKQSNGAENTFISMYAEPDVFMYEEREDGSFVPSLSITSQESNIITSFTNSDVSGSDVRFKLLTDRGDEIFGYDDYTGNGIYDISGFYYDPATNFDSFTSTATATLNIGDRTGINDPGFDLIVHYGDDDDLDFGSVIVFASGIGSTAEHAVTISMQTQGSMGKSPVYRGVWDPSSNYVGLNDSQGAGNASLLRGDVVYTGGNYYIAKLNNQGQPPPNNDTFWDTFGAQFESVATDLLLAKDAYITHELTLGVDSNDPNPFKGSEGVIHTVNKTGISDTTAGFYLSSDEDNYFGVGDGSQFIRFGGGTLSINAQNFTFGSSSADDVYLNETNFDLGTSSDNVHLTNSSFDLGTSSDNVHLTNSSFDLGSSSDTLQLSNSNFDLHPVNSNNHIKTDGTRVEIQTDYFYVGNAGSASNPNINGSYMLFDTTDDGKLIINSSYFEGGVKNVTKPSTRFNFTNYEQADPLAAFVGGGYNNSIEIPSGQNNYKSIGSAIVAGAENSIIGRFSFIGGGYDNDCQDNFSVIAGGYNNDMPEVDVNNAGANIIGGGQSNQINGGSNQGLLGGSNNKIIYNPPEVVFNASLNLKGNVIIDPDSYVLSPDYFGNPLNNTDANIVSGPTTINNDVFYNIQNSWIGNTVTIPQILLNGSPSQSLAGNAIVRMIDNVFGSTKDAYFAFFRYQKYEKSMWVFYAAITGDSTTNRIVNSWLYLKPSLVSSNGVWIYHQSYGWLWAYTKDNNGTGLDGLLFQNSSQSWLQDNNNNYITL